MCQIDQSRYILGDDSGKLFLLGLLDKNDKLWNANSNKFSKSFSDNTDSDNFKMPVTINIALLGQSVVSRSIAYLDNSILLIAGDQSDSEIVKIRSIKSHVKGSKKSLGDNIFSRNKSTCNLRKVSSEKTSFNDDSNIYDCRIDAGGDFKQKISDLLYIMI